MPGLPRVVWGFWSCLRCLRLCPRCLKLCLRCPKLFPRCPKSCPGCPKLCPGCPLSCRAFGCVHIQPCMAVQVPAVLCGLMWDPTGLCIAIPGHTRSHTHGHAGSCSPCQSTQGHAWPHQVAHGCARSHQVMHVHARCQEWVF